MTYPTDIEEALSEAQDETFVEIDYLKAKVALLESYFSREPEKGAKDYKVEIVLPVHQLVPGDIITYTGAFAVYEVESKPKPDYKELGRDPHVKVPYTMEVCVLSSTRKHKLITRLPAGAQVSVLVQAPLPADHEWVDLRVAHGGFGIRGPGDLQKVHQSRQHLFDEGWSSV